MIINRLIFVNILHKMLIIQTNQNMNTQSYEKVIYKPVFINSNDYRHTGI